MKSKSRFRMNGQVFKTDRLFYLSSGELLVCPVFPDVGFDWATEVFIPLNQKRWTRLRKASCQLKADCFGKGKGIFLLLFFERKFHVTCLVSPRKLFKFNLQDRTLFFLFHFNSSESFLPLKVSSVWNYNL